MAMGSISSLLSLDAIQWRWLLSVRCISCVTDAFGLTIRWTSDRVPPSTVTSGLRPSVSLQVRQHPRSTVATLNVVDRCRADVSSSITEDAPGKSYHCSGADHLSQELRWLGQPLYQRCTVRRHSSKSVRGLIKVQPSLPRFPDA